MQVAITPPEVAISHYPQEYASESLLSVAYRLSSSTGSANLSTIICSAAITHGFLLLSLHRKGFT